MPLNMPKHMRASHPLFDLSENCPDVTILGASVYMLALLLEGEDCAYVAAEELVSISMYIRVFLDSWKGCMDGQ